MNELFFAEIDFEFFLAPPTFIVEPKFFEKH